MLRPKGRRQKQMKPKGWPHDIRLKHSAVKVIMVHEDLRPGVRSDDHDRENGDRRA